LRSLGQSPQPVVVLQRGEEAVADVAQAAKPKSTPQLGEVYAARRPPLSANQDATRPAMSPLRRQNPRGEPGALAAPAGICAGAGSNPRPYRDQDSHRLSGAVVGEPVDGQRRIARGDFSSATTVGALTIALAFDWAELLVAFAHNHPETLALQRGEVGELAC